MQELKQLYIETFKKQPKTVEQLKGAGSNRRYFRFTDADGQSVIGAIGTSVEENNAFVYLARHFAEKQLPVPEVYAVSADGMRYLLQDLGSRSLFDAIADGRESGGKYKEDEIKLIGKCIKTVPVLQQKGMANLDWSICYPQPCFDKQNVFFDLNYFKYCFLKATGLEFNEIKLEKDFQKLADDLTAEDIEYGFMYRDFQARNIMLDRNDNPYFIDFQGGRRGPLCYDLASFLWQASARYSDSLRKEMTDIYYDELQKYTALPPREQFDEQLALFVLFRLMQVLGAYGFRGYLERKQHFIDSIPPAIENLKQLLAEHAFPYPYLTDILNALVTKMSKAAEISDKSTATESLAHSATTAQSSSEKAEKPVLTVRIFSFSYKKGIPADPSGNGGGYVFDCRSTHNPGRYAPYKKITGLDERVIKFLEDDGEILTFLNSVYKLADAHIERYLQRGFTSLMFSFGCTGGQHRSVYSAQHLADRIRRKYPQVKVELCHREQERPRALIFAAGLGTRLKPLTNTIPKALVRVGEKTLLERTITTLKAAGIDQMVVNVHHFSDQIKSFFAENDFGVDIQVSDETDKLLDTGGGLLKARSQFNGVAPILIHNVDIISNANLEHLMAESKANDAVATLLVSKRPTSRYLHFDDEGYLVGWQNVKTGEVKGRLANPYAFSGIHIVKQSIFPLLEEYATDDKFGITDFYLWACQKHKIRCVVQDDLDLTDVGKLDTLDEISKKFK